MPGSVTPFFEDLCRQDFGFFYAWGKLENEDITTSSSICFIDVSCLINLQELFLSQVLIYAMCYSPP